MLEGLISNHGQSNVQGAMNNNMMGSLVGQLGQAIQSAPGIPQFARDEMCQALNDVQQSCPAEPTPPGCQQDTDDAMSGLIDKIVDKVVDQIMEKLQGGGCESGGDLQDMVRQAIEDVVREKIDGGCGSDGNSATAEPNAGNGSNCTRTEGNGSGSNWVDDFTAKEGDRIAKNSCESDKEKEGKNSNWLVALAKAMAQVQNKFLSAAMENQREMQENTPDSEATDKSSEDEKRKKFMEAQSQYSANMQMFNQVATTTATTLKTLGEALAAISRKQ